MYITRMINGNSRIPLKLVDPKVASPKPAVGWVRTHVANTLKVGALNDGREGLSVATQFEPRVRGEVLRILKTIGATIGVVLSFFYLGCGSMQVAQAGIPNISQVMPLTLLAGSTGATVQITGSNFSSNTVVLWNGGPLNTTVINDTTLASPVESANLAMPGVAQLAVRNSITGVSSPAVQLTIRSATRNVLSIATTSLPSATYGSSYNQSLTATGGTGPYTWSIASGNLPAGITLSSSGVLSGTPTATGSFSFKVNVQDHSTPTLSRFQSLTLVVSAPPLSISTTSLASASVNQTYSQTLQANGGTPSYAWTVVSGSLPPGLSLGGSSGIISGAPTTTGNFAFTVRVSDRSSPQQAVSTSLSISVSNPIQISTPSLTGGMVGSSYSRTLAVSGGIPAYTWSVAAGSLPTGLSLSSAGVIAGTPTASGSYTFTVDVRDSSNPALTQTAVEAISIAPAPLKITTSALPAGASGTSYSQAMQAIGGSPSYQWSLKSGSLPTGLTLTSAGTISGTPSATGSFTFTARVSDTSNPVQTASAVLTLSIAAAAANPLSISNSALASGTVGTTYAQSFAATGGTPAYTWSIASGSLPAGLTLAATTGVISGKPTGSGTSSFTVAVRDNGSPAQTATAPTSITIASSQAAPSSTSSTSTTSTSSVTSNGGTIWYIRPDGGTRFSANVPNGQCDGQADAPYPGSGVNQHCAFNDFRYMWDDGSGLVGAGSWVMAGGDTVLIRGCSALPGQVNASNPDCRLGWDGPTGAASDNWCYAVGSYTCYNPPIPAGTATQHTRILGQNYASCNANGATNPKDYAPNLTQLFGGFSLTYTFNLQNTQYVDIQCIELTTHNGQCTALGSPSYPRPCNGNQPLDDYAQNGFLLNNKSSNITFQDVYVHGFNSSGFDGPIGGPINMTRVYSGFNAFSGWNFDDGSDTPDAAGSSITANYVMMEGNGCYEQYPISNTQFPARACYDSVSNGFGDAWSGQDTELDSFVCDHCVDRYNTKDGFIGPHTAIRNLVITNSVAIGNMGAQWKWGQTLNATLLFQNNLTVTNCVRMSETLPGAAQNFAQSTGLGGSYLTNYCRAAGNGFAMITRSGSNNVFDGNTVISVGNVTFEQNCGYYTTGNVFNQETNCGNVPIVFENNNFLGYTDPSVGAVPALYYADTGTTINFTGNHNSEFGLKSGTTDTCGVNGIICNDPLMVNAPLEPWPGTEAGLDAFDPFATNNSFHPTTYSPLVGAGTAITGLLTDYYSIARPTPPAIGGVQP